MEPKNYSRQYKDINSFQTCPVIFNKFNSFIKPKSDLLLIQEDLVKSLMFKEMELNQYPDIRSMKTIWDKDISRLKKKGTPLETCNNVSMRIQEFYHNFKKQFYDKGYRPIGVDFLIEYISSSSVYTAVIPILLGNTDKELIPIYMSDIGARNNEIRFNSAVLSDRIKYKINHIYNMNSLSLKISEYKTTIKELDRSLVQLSQVMQLMEYDYTVPNTSYCKYCNFNSMCRL